MLAALEFRISTPTAAHFLESVGLVDQCDARQQNLAQSLIELTITDHSVSGHLPSHLLCSAVFVPSWSSVSRVSSSRRSLELEPRWLSYNFFGSDGDPTPRGVVGFVFLQALVCHFTCQHVKGHSYCTALTLCRDPRRVQRSCLVAGCWYAWENNPTRDSWEHVGAPERALRGGSCFPRIPGSHCF